MFARILAGLTALALLAPARADDKSDLLDKQKATAAANWKKLEFEKPAPLVETAHFLIYARTPEAKTKTIAVGLDKMYAAMLKALDYKGDDQPWSGKLAVYVLTDRADFVSFMRKVIKKSPKEDESSVFTFLPEDSSLVVGMPKSGKIDPEPVAKYQLAVAILERKMGAGEPPDWVAQGFADASQYRAANPTAKGKGAGAMVNVPLMEIWGERLPPLTRQKYAAYIIDYLAYGPMADQFPAFVGALRPDEAGNPASIDAALKVINLDAATLSTYARSWTKPKTKK